jgi:hypothetical protein
MPIANNTGSSAPGTTQLLVDISYIKKTLKQFCSSSERKTFSQLSSIQLGLSLHCLIKANIQLRNYIDTSNIAEDSTLFLLLMSEDANSALSHLLNGIV